MELEDENEENINDGQTFFLNIQESQGAVKIGKNLYSKECIEYWTQQMQNNENEIWKGPGKCWCDQKLNKNQSCDICEQRWNDCESYKLLLGDDCDVIHQITPENPSYKIQIEEENILLQIAEEKSVAIGELDKK